MRKEPNNQDKDFAKIFNMNTIFSKVMEYMAYLILLGSLIILTYLSFIDRFNSDFDWKTLTVFSAATIFLSYWCWNIFYRKQYEKVMAEDINQQLKNKYCIHARYYVAIKDYTDKELQDAIDKFNEEYTAKWERWVEKYTGIPLETKKVKIVDPETGEERIEEIKGIKDLPYTGFKHKILMWRIKHHVYPQSGYKTSMELMSLLSYRDANTNKRNLKADKNYFTIHSTFKIILLSLIIVAGGSIAPDFIDGNIAQAIFKLILAVGSLLSSTFMGALNGLKGGKLKLAIVEEVCGDLEKWSNKKPIISPFEEPKKIEVVTTEEVIDDTEKVIDDTEVTDEIFSEH